MKTNTTLSAAVIDAGRSPAAWMIVIILAWLAITMPSLMSYPFPNMDEAWIGSVSVQYLQHQNFGIPIISSRFDSGQSAAMAGRISSLVQALIFYLFGAGIEQGRMFNVFGAVISAALVFALGKRLYSPWVGVLATVIYLFSWRVIHASHQLRPNIWVIVGGLSCLHLFIIMRQKGSKPAFFLPGLLIAILIDVYPTAIFFLFLLSTIVLLTYWHPENWGFIAYYALGGMVGTLYWIAVHLLPDPQLILNQLTYMSSNLYAQSEITVVRQIQYLIEIYVIGGLINSSRIGALETGYIAIGLVGLAVRRNAHDKLLLTWIAIFIAGFTFLVGRLSTLHIALWMPFLSIAIAATLLGLGNWLAPRIQHLYLSPEVLALILGAPLLAAYIGGSVYISLRTQPIAYAPYAQQLRALVPPGSNVFGDGAWYFHFIDGQFTIEAELMLPRPPADKDKTSQVFLEDTIARRNIDVILIDEILDLASEESAVQREILLDYATTNCHLAGTVDGVAYGIDWPGPPQRHTDVFLCP